MFQRLLVMAVFLGCLKSGGLTAADPAPAPLIVSRDHPPFEPVEKVREGKVDPRFLAAHEKFLERIKAGPIGVLLIGDSITAGWTRNREPFERTFGAYQPANFGISGDRTQHVLWRFDNGELDISPSPKVIVLMIGANNMHWNTAADISQGIETIVSRVRTKHPTTKVLLLGTLPMGVDPKDPAVAPLREKVIEINQRSKALADGTNVVFLDFGEKMLNDDGTSSPAMRPDGVHLEARGYEIWAESISPVLATMMK